MDSTTKRERFFKMPADLVMHPKISDLAVRVFGVMMNAQRKGEATVKLKTLAGHLGKSGKTAGRGAHELAKHNFIEIVGRNGLASTYRISSRYTPDKNVPGSKETTDTDVPTPGQKCPGTPDTDVLTLPRSFVPRSFLTKSIDGFQKIKKPTTTSLEDERGFALIALVQELVGLEPAKARSETEALVRQANGNLDLAYAWLKVAGHTPGVKSIVRYAMGCIKTGEFPANKSTTRTRSFPDIPSDSDDYNAQLRAGTEGAFVAGAA